MKKLETELKNLDFNRIELWPAHIKYPVIFIFAVVVFAVGFWFFDRPQYRALSSAVFAEKTAKQTLAQNIPKSVALRTREAYLNKLKDKITAHQEKIPKREFLEMVLQHLTKLAVNNQLEILLLKPLAPTRDNVFYEKIPITFKVLGSYVNIVHFTHDLAQLSYYLYPESIMIRPVANQGGEGGANRASAGNLVMDSTIEMFYFSPEIKGRNEKK